jgi:hypothetical protein
LLAMYIYPVGRPDSAQKQDERTGESVKDPKW